MARFAKPCTAFSVPGTAARSFLSYRDFCDVIIKGISRGNPSTPVENPMTPVEATEQRHHRNRAMAASALSTSIEWYDFLLYGVAAATVFPRKFFPGPDPFIAALLSFSTFFVGFVGRPIGGAIFGHFGDWVGRRKPLILTVMMTGLSTAGIGLVPSYEMIGIWGAVLLTVGRVLQGISLGGAWSGSVLIASEWSHPKRRGFATSFAQAGGPFGMVLANGALGFMTRVTSEQPIFAAFTCAAVPLTTIQLRGGMWKNTTCAHYFLSPRERTEGSPIRRHPATTTPYSKGCATLAVSKTRPSRCADTGQECSAATDRPNPKFLSKKAVAIALKPASRARRHTRRGV